MSASVFAQKSEYINETEQIGNHNFENFDNPGTKNVEPAHWNSFMTCTGSLAAFAQSQQLDRSTEKRPGSTGQYSVRIYSKKAPIGGVIANGNLTTGRINAGDPSPAASGNYNFTQRGNTAHNHPFSSIPDSVVVWLKFNPGNASDQGSFEVILHDDNDTRAPGYNESQVVAYVQAFIDKKDAQWQRISFPFDKKPNTNVKYCLINATTNKTPGGGSNGDELYIDDLLFVYNPVLTLHAVPQQIGIISTDDFIFNVSYTLKGTMNPYNNLPDNKIIVELSDAVGSFANPRVIGELTTFTSGTVPCTIPNNIPRGSGYRIRLRSTNYPLITPDNGADIDIFNAYIVNADAANHRGTVTGNKGVQKAGGLVSLTATANQGNKFICWMEGSDTVAKTSVISFILERDRNLLAHFDSASWVLTVSAAAGGSVSGSETGTYLHNYPVSLHAEASAGYEFSGYYEGGVNPISTAADFSFLLTKDRTIEARFSLRKYIVNVQPNNAIYGIVTGGGQVNYNSEVTLQATANPYCEFVCWINGNDTLGKLPTLNYNITQSVSITGVFREISYPVVVNRNPPQGGTVSGAGLYSAFNANSTITVRANPSAGYGFEKFVDDSTLVSTTQNPLTVIAGGRITSAKSYTAYFVLNTYEIVVSASTGGQAGGAGQYEHGSSVVLSAAANEGYEFAGWVYGSDTLSKLPQISFVADRDTALNAVFRLKKYLIAVTNENPSMGDVSGNGVYSHFSTAVLTASAFPDYEFRSWVLDDIILDTVSPLNYAVTGAADIKANFSIMRKNVTVEILPAGTGFVSGAGRYEHNEQVTLVASADTGYLFAGWEDALGNLMDIAATSRFNIVKDTLIVARFKPDSYKIEIEANNSNGTVSFDGSQYSSSRITRNAEYNTVIPLYAAVVTDGYKFTGWKRLGSSGIVSIEDTFLYTVKKDEYLIAAFSNTAVFLSASAEPSYAGTINGNGNYEKGSWYPLTAIASYGYVFKEWKTLDGVVLENEDENSLMVYAGADTSFIAVFEKDSFDVNIVSDGCGLHEGSGRYCYQDTAKLTAHVSGGYHFAGWYLNNNLLLSEDTVIKIEVDKPYSITARFDSNAMQLTVLSTHPHNSTVSPSRETKYSRTETLYATAGEGIHFIGWKHNNDTVFSDTVKWLVTNNDTLTALFDTNIYTFTFTNSTPLKGNTDLIIDGNITLNSVSEITRELYHKTSVKIIAVPNYGYHFTGGKDTMFFVITGDTNITAQFSENIITVLSSCNPLYGYTSVKGGNAHAYGNSVTVEAVPNIGYCFAKWTLAQDTSVVFSTNPVVSFIAVRDTNIVAHFEKENYNVTIEVSNDMAGTVTLGSETSAQINTSAPFNSTLTVYAQPLRGYHFSHWLNDGTVVSEDTFYNVAVTHQTVITAVFEANLHEVSLSVNSDIFGSVEGGGMYRYGYAADIKATSNANYYFDKWVSETGKFISFDSVYSFIVTGDTALIAVFRTDTFNISVDIVSGGGTVSGGGRFLLGQEVSLQAEADYGYTFSEWQNDSAAAVSNSNPFVFDASASMSLHAVFVPQVFNVNINTNAGSNTDIRGAGSYRYGDNAYLFAFSNDIYTFDHWELSDSTVFTKEELLNNMLFYSVEKDLEIRAVYKVKTYNVTASVSPVESGSVFNTGVYFHGSTFTLEATPAEHYHFVGWVLDSAYVSAERRFHVDSIYRDLEFIAVFELNHYTVTLTCYPSAGGTLNGGGQYFYGDTATLSVTLNYGYALDVWRDEKFFTIGNTTSIKYVVTKNSDITAALKDALANEPISDLDGARVKVYPNPVSAGDVLYVDGLESGATAALYDFTGKVMLKTDRNPISVAGISRGMYLLRLTFSDGTCAVGKIVVR